MLKVITFHNGTIMLLTLIFLLQHSVEAEDCNPNRKCLSCPVGLPYHCTSCENGYYLRRGDAYMSCEPCPTACNGCNSMYACTRCVNGRYGSLCENLCGKGCIDSTCDQYLGICGCKRYFSGTHCDRCSNGKYGYEFNDCKLNCPSNCKTCVSDKNCTLCNDGYFGLTCENICSSGCYSGTCTQNNGTCFGNQCKPNFTGVNCDKCDNGRHGKDCGASCPENCASCSAVTSCDLCKAGQWGTACERNCSHGCFNGTCFKESGICTGNRCKTGFAGDTCENYIDGLRGVKCNINETLIENDSSATLHMKDFHKSVLVTALLLCVKEFAGT